VRNGGYERWFWVDWKDVRGWVFRKYCRKCEVAFTLLPLVVLAHWQYPFEFVLAWLWAALHGTSCRSRDFLVSQGVPLPGPEADASWSDQQDEARVRRDHRPPRRLQGTAWSDQQDEARVRPCYQLLARWTREFAVRAARLVPALTSCCVLLGLDLKNVADAISGLRVTRPRLSALPVALGLVHVLRRALAPDVQPDLEDCLSELVLGLARRRLPPSHRVVRVSGARLVYDSLIT
jgi:hypothetical protein